MKRVIGLFLPRNYIPALLWLSVILVLSLTPGKELPAVDIWSFDKFAHIGVYILLVWLWLRAILQSHDIDQKIFFKKSSLVFWTTVGFGVVLEFMQGAWITDRYFDQLDIVANTIGCLAGVFAYRLFDHKL